jgi:hypothetical protein
MSTRTIVAVQAMTLQNAFLAADNVLDDLTASYIGLGVCQWTITIAVCFRYATQT